MASVQSRSKVNRFKTLDSPLAYHRLVPKHRYPFPGSDAIFVGAATQFHFAVEKPDESRVAKSRDDLALILELREESHVRSSFRCPPPCHPPGWSSKRTRWDSATRHYLPSRSVRRSKCKCERL